MNTQTETHTRLHGRWLLIARLAWAAMFITLTVMYAFGFLAVHETLSTICEAEPCSLRVQIRPTDAGEKAVRWPGPPVGFADRLRPDQVEGPEKLGLSLDQYGWLGALQLGIPALILLLIAAGLFWWMSNDWMVLFASIMVATFAVHNSPLPFALLVLQPAWEWVESLAGLVALSCLLIFPLIFPTGQFVPRWTRWMALYAVASAVIASFLPILEIFGDVLGRVFIGLLVLLPFGLGIYAQLYRYFRVARPAERQQFKWVVLALSGALVIQFAVLIPLNALLTSPAFSADPARALVLSAIPDTLWQVNNLFIAVCIVISVLRYRLWDIDIIINRALVYFTLTGIIGGLYILVVGSLGSLMQNRNDVAATAVALLIVVALFQPLRRALQNGVNRLLRFDPGKREESLLSESSVPSEEAHEANVQIHAIPEPDLSSHTRLHGRWLLIARLTWIAIAILAMVIYVAAAPVAFNQMRFGCGLEPCYAPSQISSEPANSLPEQVRPPRDFDGWVHTILEATFRLLSLIVALLIFYRRSDDWMANVASIMLVTIFVVFSPSPMMLANAQPLWRWPIILLRAIALTSTVGLFYLFPDGRFVPRWTRWLAISLLALIGALVAAGAPFKTGLPVFIIALATGAGFQVYRYRWVSTPLQRQQTKWVVLGITGMVLPLLVFFIFGYLNSSLNPLQSNEPILSQGAAVFTMVVIFCVIIPLCFLPVTLAFSLLRYRLWDVDILINRTLVYGALTASVVALYVLIVGWSSIGLQTQNNLAGSVFAVLVIAFLFRPLRQRLQRIADRFVPVPQTALPAEQHKHQIAIPEGQSATDTRLRGRWLLIARLAWAMGFIALTTMYMFGFIEVREALSTVCEEEQCTLNQQIRHTEAGDQIMGYLAPPIGYADRLRPNQVEELETLGLPLDRYGWLAALQMGLPLLVYLLIAAGLFWRKSDDWMVLFASVMVATIPIGPVPLLFTLAVRQPAWEWVFDSTGMVAISCFLIFPFIFPTGRFVPRWTRWMILFDIAFAVIVSLFRDFISGNPDAEDVVFVYLLTAFATGIYAQLYRYFRVASPVERQQLKWVIVGLAGFVSIAVAVLQPLDALLTSRAVGMDPARALLLSVIPDTIFQAILLFIPVSIAISVLRYHLWDIDIIINRTLVYGALTGVVVSAFVILVGFLSVLFQSSGNSIIAIVATGLVALLFNPLRQRLQRGINRLMYGERDEPYTALSRLGRRLETTLAPESVLPTVVTTVRDVLRLPYVAIYLQQDSHGYKIVAESASPVLRIENGRIRVPGMEREGRCIPLIHQGETVGYIVLGPRSPNEAFSTTDLNLLQDLAPQVGVAVHAVRLTADLQRSRERLVLAREEERRRLRRDLHDGLGPQLAGLALKLETLRNRINGDPLTDSILADLAKQTQNATADIRHLVYELRPPTLDELGLVMALREGVTQFSQQGSNDLNFTLDAPESLPALPAAVEVAVYRITQEALTNVIRHAGAHNCYVRLSLDESAGFLCLEVQDDGKGLLMKRRVGVGLNSMRERSEELGGTFTITPILTGGTLLTAKLPCKLDLKFAARDAVVSSDEER
ncbi:MAG: GAF domain-containing protein [Chloroflexi bacterium]|nr:MAG: GAF domain-containing protein [Chloroflexota bacterium]